MDKIALRARSGPDGVVHVDVASSFPDRDLDIVVFLHPANRQPGGHWPSEFFTEVVGGWNGEPLRREDERALANNMVLVTHNTGEFGRVDGLRIEDWERP